MKILSLIVTLFVGLLTSFTTIYVAYTTNKPNMPAILHKDQLELDRISDEIEIITTKFYQTQDSLRLAKFDAELLTLAKREADLMKKYYPDFEPRWPPLQMPVYADSVQSAYLYKHHGVTHVDYSPRLLVLPMLLIVFLIFFLYYAYKVLFPSMISRILSTKYEVH